ncbi:molybdenum cofactor guanylyltransferase [Candidatus Oleimmundimicrobium sp.]|uniref:molybdenum cofactor guanylyltransferase n=1 Tax=Candidatus Oleimmundimicrobium sp. TaxID=3060597 RepID=UPI002723EE3E|nr:molybdenum cofactor guanylyltransferase [Candidatus Oleimmundimicrobium sp.]MDO8886905.1 molybdenum cofactor guanylyltransferase [Candidatus Oleimmundimicrobium sp.]
MEKIAGIILTGGKSSRLGTDKCLLKLGAKTILEDLVGKLYLLCEEVILVSNTPELHKMSGVEVAQDEIPHQGPLGGMLAGLKASNHFHNFIVSCDTPFLNLNLAKHLIAEAKDFDVVIPESKSGPEPLQAIYSKNCVGYIEERLRNQDFKIISFFKDVKVKKIKEDKVIEFDSRLLSFYNINTFEDFERAKEIYVELEK